MKLQFYLGVIFFGFAVSAGFLAGGTSLNGYVWFADTSVLNGERQPAAIRREIDFSRLDGAELITATQNRLISAARVEIHDDGVGVVLGHFATRGEDGQRHLACDSYYNRLTLTFEAEGIADAGEKPKMVIDAPCKSSAQDVGSIDAVVIPYQKIIKEHAANMDLTFDEGVNFKFDDMGTTWPLHWALQNVRLYNDEDATHEVKITSSEIRDIRKSSFIIHWQDTNRIPAEYRK